MPDGTAVPGYQRDPGCTPSRAWPGAELPHTWVSRGGPRISTLDLAGHGRITLVTGVGGEPWLDATAELGADLGLAVTPALIGPGQPYEDPSGTSGHAARVDDGGMLLVRPDLCVAPRRLAAPASAEQARDGSPPPWPPSSPAPPDRHPPRARSSPRPAGPAVLCRAYLAPRPALPSPAPLTG